MNSEKVKEIKDKLKAEISIAENYEFEYRSLKLNCLQDILTLINELESENKSLQDLCNKTYEDLTKEIDRLEKEIKENPSYAKGYADGIKNTYEAMLPQKLENFAERLKDNLEEYRLENEYFTEHEPNGNLWQLNSSVFCIEVTQNGGLIDETLKEFIKN